MMFHPVCGTRVRTALKLLIAFDIIVTVIALHMTILGICLLLLGWIPHPEYKSSLNVTLSSVVVFAVFFIMDIILDVWLWILIPQNNQRKCQIWFSTKLTLEVCDAIAFIVELTCGLHTAVYIVPMTLDFILSGYFLWVVFTFMMELQKPKVNKVVKFFKTKEESSLKSTDP